MSKQKTAEEYVANIRESITFLKAKQNLASKKIAKQAGGNADYRIVDAIKAGKSSNPTISTMVRIADGLKISVIDLLTGLACDKHFAETNLDKLIDNYLRSSPGGRRHIEEAAELQAMKTEREKAEEKAGK